MIKINRLPKPNILIKKEAAWLTAIKNATNKKDREEAIKKYQNKKIKSTLIAMFYGKCAFCESYIENVDYGDIEHFKPKSLFPEEAINWDNLLLSCKKCNGAGQKGDAWPLNNEGGPLINPCTENPNDYFNFEFDTETDVAIVKPKNVRGEVSEKLYGLNKLSLVKDRNITIKRLVALAQFYNSNDKAKRYLDEAALDSGEYAAFARMIRANFVK
ncbi:HNH endonuclease family protein [Mucilaginibacter sp.]